MRGRYLLAAAVVLLSFSGLPRASGQSLADVAKKEGERRKEVKEPTKVFTNGDLPNAPASSSAVPPAAAPDATPAAAKDAAAGAAKADDKSAASKPKDQKYWADGIKALHDKVATDQLLLDAMQNRVSSLTADFTNRDDPGQRSVIAQDRQKALDQLSTLKQAVADDNKAISDFEEEARKSGVPPGWLR